MSEPPYPMPAKCEGESRVFNAISRTEQPQRCQRSPVAWNEEKYQWVCAQHNRKKRKGLR